MILELQSIYKDYLQGKDAVSVLKDISLCVDEEEYVAIMGPSGSGKSTLMNIIGCLDKQTSGIFLFDDIDIADCSDKELSEIRNRKIGFVFQNFNLLPRESAIENVELPLIYRGIKKNKRKHLAERALALVDLESRAKHLPGQLSGGQQQRVAIARAIASSPPLILADEPTGNLDVSSGSEIMNILSRLHSRGKTIIMITHDNTIAHRVPRRVEISDGKLV